MFELIVAVVIGTGFYARWAVRPALTAYRIGRRMGRMLPPG